MITDLSRSTFLQKLEHAPLGQWIMYHVGFLYEDRAKNRRLASLATEVYRLGLDGKVCLIQRKLGHAMYEYYAVKR